MDPQEIAKLNAIARAVATAELDARVSYDGASRRVQLAIDTLGERPIHWFTERNLPSGKDAYAELEGYVRNRIVRFVSLYTRAAGIGTEERVR